MAKESPLRNKKVLVTGATGFIGNRVVERLILEEGALVRVLLRQPKSASRVARFPVEFVMGDVSDKTAINDAAKGCTLIIHCAYDFLPNKKLQRDVNVQGAHNVARAALENQSRLVHLSTIDVYGPNAGEVLSEKTTRNPIKGDPYSETKSEVEKVFFEYHRSRTLQVVVLQPTVVYGPFCRPWTIGPIQQLREGKVGLIDRGHGRCNVVFIDDLVDAIIQACRSDRAIGQDILISGQAVSWKEFYGAFEQMLHVTSTVEMSLDEMKKERRRQLSGDSWKQIFGLLRDPVVFEKIRHIPLLQRTYGFMERYFPKWITDKIRANLFDDGLSPLRENDLQRKTDRIHIPDLRRLPLFRSSAIVQTDKAKEILGYEPKVSFQEGMKRAEQYARWANLF